MRRHHHRISKDVDIFVADPQWLGYLTPRLNARAESLVSNYLEQAGFLKLYFDEGEIDFVACTPLTQAPAVGFWQNCGNREAQAMSTVKEELTRLIQGQPEDSSREEIVQRWLADPEFDPVFRAWHNHNANWSWW